MNKETKTKSSTGNTYKELFTVGFIVPDIMNPFYASLTNELELLCHTFGMQLQIGYSRDNIEKEEEIIDNFLKSGVNALIISSSAKEELPYPFEVPIVYIDRQLDDHKHHFVSTSHSEGALTLLRELSRGYEGDIAFVGACKELDSSIQRLDAFKEILKQGKKDFREDITYHGLAHSTETGKAAYHFFKDALVENIDLPDEDEEIEAFKLKEKLRFFFTSYPLLEGFVTEKRQKKKNNK